MQKKIKKKKSASQNNNSSPFKPMLIGAGAIAAVLVAVLIFLIAGQADPAQQPQGEHAANNVTNTNTGPVIPAAWDKVGEMKGEMQTLLFDPSNPKTAYLGTNGNGIYRSSDGGTTWDVLGPAGKTILDLSIDPQSSRLYFAEMKEGFFFSDDEGRGWGKISNLPAGEAHVIQVDPRNPQIIWAGFWLRGKPGSTLYKSEDGGKSWQTVSGGPQSFDITMVKFDDAGKDTYVGTYGGGLFRTSDNGKNWTALNNGLKVDTDITLLEWNKDKSVFYAATHDYGVFRSTDRGTTWQEINTGKESAMDVHGLVVDPQDSDSIYVAGMMHGKGLFKSTNKGDTWQPLQADGINLDDVHILSLNPERTHIYIGSGEHGEGKGTLFRLKL